MLSKYTTRENIKTDKEIFILKYFILKYYFKILYITVFQPFSTSSRRELSPKTSIAYNELTSLL